MKGILNIDKPKGMTSSDVVSRVRRILGCKSVGHFGTLDPMGEGVLLMGVGKATRLFDMMLSKDKVYEAEFDFGIDTDTLDTEGTVLSSSGPVPALNEIESVLGEFIGKQMQIPPAYSAKSINGKRAYELARKGKEVVLKPCEIEIYSLKVAKTKVDGRFKFVVHCSSGTYIRSFGRDIARRLSTCAAMCSIRRLRCGGFDVEHAVSLERLSVLGEAAVLPIESALGNLAKVTLDDRCYDGLVNGIKQEADGITDGMFALYCRDELFGIAKVNSQGKIEITSYLKD